MIISYKIGKLFCIIQTNNEFYSSLVKDVFCLGLQYVGIGSHITNELL